MGRGFTQDGGFNNQNSQSLVPKTRHSLSDQDLSPQSGHHTLGPGKNQAAPGSLVDEVADLKLDIDALQEYNITQDGNITSNTTDITALKTRATNLESRATTIEGRLDALELTRPKSGTGTITPTAVATIATQAITFATPFPVGVDNSKIRVLCTVQNNGNGNYVDIRATSITRTGFTAQGTRGALTNPFAYTWVAYYDPNFEA